MRPLVGGTPSGASSSAPRVKFSIHKGMLARWITLRLCRREELVRKLSRAPYALPVDTAWRRPSTVAEMTPEELWRCTLYTNFEPCCMYVQALEPFRG